MKEKYTSQMVDKIEKSKPTALIARHVNKRFSKYFTAFFANRGLSPNDVTTLSFLVAIAASAFFLAGNYIYIVIAGLLTLLSSIFDSCDGELARLTGKSSIGGRWWDGVLDVIKKDMLFGSIAIGQFLRFNNPLYLIFVFFTITNIYFIEEINGLIQIFLPHSGHSKGNKKPELIVKGDYFGLIDTISVLILVFALIDQLLILLIIMSIFPIPLWLNQIRRGRKRMGGNA